MEGSFTANPKHVLYFCKGAEALSDFFFMFNTIYVSHVEGLIKLTDYKERGWGDISGRRVRSSFFLVFMADLSDGVSLWSLSGCRPQ